MNTKSKHEVRVEVNAKDRASKNFNSIAMGAVKIGAAFFGVQRVLGFAKESFQLWERQHLAVRNLTRALDNLGAKSQIAGMQSFASQIQSVTRIGDEATLEMMAMGAALGLQGDRLKAATIAALGYAKAMDMSLTTAMRNIAQAANGNASQFRRLGIVTDDAKTAAEEFQQVLAFGTSAFELQKVEVDNLADSMVQLSNTWGDFKESLVDAAMGEGGGLSWFDRQLQETSFLLQNIKAQFDDIYLSALAATAKSTPEHYSEDFAKAASDYSRQASMEMQRAIIELNDPKPLETESLIESAIKGTAKAIVEAEVEKAAVKPETSSPASQNNQPDESRFLTMRVGSPIDKTAENTRKMALLQEHTLSTQRMILDVLSRGGNVRTMVSETSFA